MPSAAPPDPPVAAGRRGVALLAAAGVATGAIELWLGRALLTESNSPLPLFATHIAVTIALAVASLPARRWKIGGEVLMLATLTGALGAIGVAGATVTFALVLWFRRKPHSAEEWYQALFPDTPSDPVELLFEELEGDRSDDAGTEPLTAFGDALAFGSLAEKQRVLTLIGERFHPALAPLLRRALADTNSAIRVHTATVLGRVQKAFMERAVRLEEAVAAAPDAANWRDLAQHYDAHAFSGVLDAVTQTEVQRKAIAAFERFLEMLPDDVAAHLRLGRLLLRCRRPTDALPHLERAHAAGLPVQDVVWLIQCLFELRRYSAVRRLALEYLPAARQLQRIPLPMLHALTLWASNPQSLRQAA